MIRRLIVYQGFKIRASRDGDTAPDPYPKEIKRYSSLIRGKLEEVGTAHTWNGETEVVCIRVA